MNQDYELKDLRELNNSPLDLSYRDYINRDKEFTRAPFVPEQEFYDVVSSGNLKEAKKFCKNDFTKQEGLGRLSTNTLQNYKYHFVITAAMLARSCIAGGMEVPQAYDISDYYILQADRAKTLSELNDLHTKICMEYAKKMSIIHKKTITSKVVIITMDYIFDHLHTRIKIDELAENAHVSREHLSRVFKKETGISVNEYICEQKLNTATNMLMYSDYSIAEIASILAFSTQSYFTKLFREREGITPLEFRNRMHRQTI